MKKAIVFITTSWGRKFGGINVLNYEICKALSLSESFYDEVVCISLDDKIEVDFNNQRLHCFTLLEKSSETKFNTSDKHEILKILEDNNFIPLSFIGHDVKSGPIAIESTNIYNKKYDYP